MQDLPPSSAPALPLAPFFPPDRILAQLSRDRKSEKCCLPPTRIHARLPACSPIALSRTGFPQAPHLMRAHGDFSGSAPNTFISVADSHCVGGVPGVDVSLGGGGLVGTLSHENGGAGDASGLSRSLTVILRDVDLLCTRHKVCYPRYSLWMLVVGWRSRISC